MVASFETSMTSFLPDLGEELDYLGLPQDLEEDFDTYCSFGDI